MTSAGAFDDLVALRIFWMEDNSLATIDEAVFHPSNHPTGLDFWGIWNNPWNCNKSLCWILDSDWLTLENPNTVECSGPGLLNGRKWDTLNELDLGCQGLYERKKERAEKCWRINQLLNY